VRALIFLLIFFLSTSQISFAQVTFSLPIDYNGGYETPIAVLETDSGYILCGSGSDFYEYGGWRVNKFVFTDKFGTVISKKIQGKIGVNYYAGLQTALVEGLANNYVLARTDYDTTIGNYNASLININSLGDTIFVRSFGGSADDYGYTVAATRDKGFVLLGQTYSYGNPANGSYYLVKTDSSGNLEWQHTYVQSANAGGATISVTHDNGFLMGGRAFVSGLGNQAMVIKTDSLGNEQWRKSYGGTGNDCGAYSFLTKDSGFVFISCQDTVINVSNTYGFYYIGKADSLGNLQWRTFMTNPEVHFLLSVRELPNGGYIACGHIEDTIITNTIVDRVGWVLRLDANGTILWERRYAYKHATLPLGLSPSEFVDVQPTADNGFILAGQTFDYNQDLWLVKLDSNGCMGNYCGLTDPNCYYLPYPDCITSINEYDEEDLKVSVYPNPATNEITISKAVTITEPVIVKLYDVYGKEQKVITAIATETVADISSISSGTYLYEIITTQGSLYQGRLIVIK